MSERLQGRAVSQDAESNEHLNVYLVDAVTGQIFERYTHKDAAPPISAVIVENRVVYHYWNQYTLESEISVVDMWEDVEEYGVDESPEFSSFKANPPELQTISYNIATQVVSFAVSRTKFGVTHKIILAALADGNLVQIPGNVLSPRRPKDQPTKEEMMEGLPQYSRYIPLPPLNILNQGNRIAGLNGVISSPSGLESTSLIVGYGVDYFFRRVTPSKSFDMLDPDFDFLVLAGVVGGVLGGIYVSKYFRKRKMVDDAWE